MSYYDDCYNPCCYNYCNPCCPPNHDRQLAEIQRDVERIERKLDSPTFGLFEIKTEVAAIEDSVGSSTFGLQEIQSEVAAIGSSVNSPTFGLFEIKTEIEQVAARVGVGANFTTGAVRRDGLVGSITNEVLNNTASVQTVFVRLYDLSGASKTLFSAATLTVQAAAASITVFSNVTPTMYEVQFLGLDPGVYGFSAGSPSGTSLFTASNTFRNSDLSALI